MKPRHLETGEADRESTRAIGQAFGVSLTCLLAAPMLTALRVGSLPRPRSAFRPGVTGMVLGLALRVWATRVLGASYTRTLRVTEHQRIVDSGPYASIRHPGYVGTLLVWLGASIALGNVTAMLPLVATMLHAYLGRMRTEEEMLQRALGAEYSRYMERTARLIPRVY